MLTALHNARGGIYPMNGGAAQPNPGTSNSVTLLNVTIKGRWKIIDTLGKGAFGEVYLAHDLQVGNQVAIKVESPSCKKQVLKLEITVMRKLQDCPFIARHIAAGRFPWPHNSTHPIHNQESPSSEHPIYSYMVMELLGPNLSELRKKCPNGRFSVATTAILGQQMVRAIEALHEIGIIHRDIKPGNFCMSVPPDDWQIRQTCYLIDFGLSRRYLSMNGKIREARAKVGFRGTARYASINAHLGLELGRVDDMWSLFYLIVEFLKGQLPWKGKEKEKIGELKQKLTSPELIAGLHPSITAFYDHLCTLRYQDAPNYDYIYDLFSALLLSSGMPNNVSLDWVIPTSPTLPDEIPQLLSNRQMDRLDENIVSGASDKNAEQLSKEFPPLSPIPEGAPKTSTDDPDTREIFKKPSQISILRHAGTTSFISNPFRRERLPNEQLVSESVLPIGGISIDATHTFSQSLSTSNYRSGARGEPGQSPPHVGSVTNDSSDPVPILVKKERNSRMVERPSSVGSGSSGPLGGFSRNGLELSATAGADWTTGSPIASHQLAEPDNESIPRFLTHRHRHRLSLTLAGDDDDIEMDTVDLKSPPPLPLRPPHPSESVGRPLLEPSASRSFTPTPPSSQPPLVKTPFRARRYQKG
ncbi:kinase-like domain-containing protein [Zopfochytrium polystomum]|nr:kinase-like domain-containing protein [Zopfochytrium polystomum]